LVAIGSSFTGWPPPDACTLGSAQGVGLQVRISPPPARPFPPTGCNNPARYARAANTPPEIGLFGSVCAFMRSTTCDNNPRQASTRKCFKGSSKLVMALSHVPHGSEGANATTTLRDRTRNYARLYCFAAPHLVSGRRKT